MKTENIEKFIVRLERKKYPILYWVSTFFSIVFLRNFLEIFSSQNGKIIDYLKFFFHFPLFWISILISILFILYLLTKEKIIFILKSMIFFFPIILLAPIIDLLMGGYEIEYIFSINDFINFFKTFKFLPIENFYGISYGIRIEVLFIAFLGALYVFVKTKKAYKSLLVAFIIPILISLYGALPVWLKLLGVSIEQKNFILAYVFLISFQTLLIFIVIYKNKLIRFLKDKRHFIFLHYLTMLLFGFWLGATKTSFMNQVSWVNLILLIISIFFGWLFAVSINDIFDIKINKKSYEFEKTAFVSFLMSSTFVLIVGYNYFLFALICACISFIYSAPPLKLKKYPIISTLLLSIISLLIAFMGFMLPGNSIKDFPIQITYLILICITLAFTVKDIKDIKGDKKEKVWTIPIIFGEKRGIFLTSLLILVSYFAVPLILNIPNLIILSLVFGLINFFIINKKKTSTSNFLLLYFVYFLLSMLLIYPV